MTYDIVNRQAVLDALCDECELFHGNGERTCLTKCDSYNILATLPSVRPQEPKWILTSDRLPNKSQWVLVTTESYQKPVEIMRYQGVQIGQHNVGNGWGKYGFPSWTSGHGDIQSHHPKAWMPLPKPYKAESEDWWAEYETERRNDHRGTETSAEEV